MTPPTADPLVNSSDDTVSQESRQTTHMSATRSAVETATSSQQNQAKYVPAATGATYWGPGNQLTFLVTGKETGGAFFLTEMFVVPGGGPPPHIHHREEESFYILEGTLTIQVGGNTITASAGDFAYLPRGIAHSFKNTGDGFAKALVLTTPAGLENYFAEVFDPATDRSATPPPPSKEMLARAMTAAPRYGLVLLPPA
jgi:quercetin dioxygenase-like cupin family protein